MLRLEREDDITLPAKYYWLIAAIAVVLVVAALLVSRIPSPNTEVRGAGEYYLRFTSDGKYLVTIGEANIRTWNVPNLKLTQTLDYTSNQYKIRIAVSPDAQLIAKNDETGTLKIWQAVNGKLLYTLSGYTDFNLLQFSEDGKFLVSSGKNGLSDKPSIRLWQTSDFELVRVWDNLLYAAISPDSKYIVVESDFQTILAQIWLINDGSLLKTLNASQDIIGGLISVNFSPDGSLLAFGVDYNKGHKGTQIWRVSDWSLLSTFSNPDGPGTLAFSPDNQVLAVGHITPEVESRLNEADIELRHVKDGSLIKKLIGHTKDVYSLAFSPDGKYLASSSKDETIRLWSLT